MDEFQLIERLFRPLATGPEALGLADDAAVLTCSLGRQFVVTTDMLQAEIHFFADDPPAAIAQKALRVNLSDLAAMGADPHHYFLAIGLPRDMSFGWLEAFAQGLAQDQARYGITLAGGDTTSTRGPLTLAITAIGTLPAGQAIGRKGAKLGDDVYLSGTLGDAALGLTVRHSTHIVKPWRLPAVERYLHPEPRSLLGPALRGLASACLDVSDGLAQDAAHLAAASGVGIEIDLAALPLSAAVKEAREDGFADWSLIVSGGDDYELLFTASPKREKAIAAAALESGTAVTKIGRVSKAAGALLWCEKGKLLELAKPGYRHRLRDIA